MSASMEQWLVISNCQTFGIANCLQAQVSDVRVTGVDTLLFNSNPQHFNAEMAKYSTLFFASEVKTEIPLAQIESIPDHVALPVFTCRAFHPDLIYLSHDGHYIDGPASHYHSAIVYACFCAGMSISDTILRFNGSFMERCGYMSMWLPERDRIVEEFADLGLDVAAPIRTWGRHSSFMYSINHPYIHVLHDIAAGLLHTRGRTPFRGSTMPHDNLAAGASFAVYPEIGEALGVAGSYAFKHNGYRPIGLEDFIKGSFACYERIGRDLIKPASEFAWQVDYISALI